MISTSKFCCRNFGIQLITFCQEPFSPRKSSCSTSIPSKEVVISLSPAFFNFKRRSCVNAVKLVLTSTPISLFTHNDINSSKSFLKRLFGKK